jgi:hypothetical protein
MNRGTASACASAAWQPIEPVAVRSSNPDRRLKEPARRTPLRAEQRLDHHLATQRRERFQRAVGILADGGWRHRQSRRFQPSRGEVLVDADLQRPRWVEHGHTVRLQTVQNIHAKHHLFQGARRHCPHDHRVESGQQVGRPGDRGADTAEVDRFRLVTEPGGSPHQVADVPAVAARQERYPHEGSPHPAPPDRVARVAGECCDCTGWQPGSVVFCRTEQTGCNKGLRLLRSGPLDVDAFAERTGRSAT